MLLYPRESYVTRADTQGHDVIRLSLEFITMRAASYPRNNLDTALLCKHDASFTFRRKQRVKCRATVYLYRITAKEKRSKTSLSES